MRNKKQHLYMLLYLVCISILQSCNSNAFTEEEMVNKRIVITFYGDFERIYPWMSFVAYTKNQETLHVIMDNDSVRMGDGGIQIERGEMGQTKQITLLSKQKLSDWTDVSVTYRKRMDSPSKSDDLKINIKGYVNNNLRLDTTNVMHAYNLNYKPTAKEYIYKIFF